MDGTVLVADDDRTIRTVLTQALTRAGCRVRATGSAATLWRWVEEGEGNAVISDIMMPDGNGLEMLPAIQRRRPDLPVIVISAQNTVMTAIKTSEAGAYDYLPKPFDLRDLLSKVSKALLQANQPGVRRAEPVESSPELPLVGRSAAMQEVYRIVARVLNTDLNVLISGQSGTGKDLLAQTLHRLGNRSAAPFIPVVAGTTTPDDVMALLSDSRNRGATVYLDELCEMSLENQLYLLSLLQSAEATQGQIRFISSSSRSLPDLVNEGLFREDLFYRLAVMPIELPPLRDRLDDIAELTRHFLQICATEGLPHKIIQKKALDQMRLTPWNGNVRGLENFVRRLVVLCPADEISAEFVNNAIAQIPNSRSDASPLAGEKLSSSVEAHIQRYFDHHGDNLPPPGLYNRIIREVELPLIALTLSATRGNQIKTAELLGINRNTLRKKIRELDIQVTRTKKMM
ncbi:MAG: response regulator [Rhodobacteraceae bacterium]|nr:response regulator [Paracoccaceae bacterium]